MNMKQVFAVLSGMRSVHAGTRDCLTVGGLNIIGLY